MPIPIISEINKWLNDLSEDEIDIILSMTKYAYKLHQKVKETVEAMMNEREMAG